MSQFDRLFASMAQRNASRAILLSDQPMQLIIGDQTVTGAALSSATLLSMLVEVVPPERQAALHQNGQFDIFQQTPEGTVRVNITREGELLRAVIDRMPQSYAQVSAPQPPPPPRTVTSTAPPPPYPTQQSPGYPTQQAAPYSPTPYGVPNYAPGTGYGDYNSSGTGATAQVPAELQGKWNWGAFFGSWVWGLAHSTWFALLALIPCVHLVMAFVLGAKGNEWAWQNRRFSSIAEFKRNQMTWGFIGFGVQCVLMIPLLFVLILPLATVAPVFGRARANAQRSSSQSNLKQLGLGVVQFSQDNNERYPTGRTLAEWKSATLRYVISENLYVHPATKEPYSVNPALSGVSIAQINSLAETPMLYEKSEDTLGGHNILFADGHVKWFKEGGWQTYRTYLNSVGAE